MRMAEPNSNPCEYPIRGPLLPWSATEREAFADATRDAVDGDSWRNDRIADLRNSLSKDARTMYRLITLRRNHAALIAGEMRES